MLYLLDANVLIDANEYYYPIDRIPQFWDWLRETADNGNIKIPYEIYTEISPLSGSLSDWINDQGNKDALLLDEDVDAALVQNAIEKGYAADLSDDELEKIGRDPFLIAYILADAKKRTLVTKEISKPSKTRGNRKIPDICNSFGANWMTDFELYKALDFRIS